MAELDTDGRLAVHEAVCAERYNGIIERVGRIEKILIGVNAALILNLLAVVGFFVSKAVI